VTTPPPIAEGCDINRAVAELAALDRWVCWRAKERRGKVTKVPFTPAGSPASSTDRSTWSTFDACLTAAFDEGKHAGVGFVLDGSDDLVGFDLDDCLERGTLKPWAEAIARRLNSYTEITPSGRGVRIFVRACIPVNGARKGALEVYKSGRYLTVTGRRLESFPDTIKRRHKTVPALFAELFGEVAERARPNGASDWPDELPEPMPRADLERECRLYPELLERHYPSASERDFALALHARRRKWSEEQAAAFIRAARQTDDDPGKGDRADYIQRTVERAYAEAEVNEHDLEQLVEQAKADPGAPFEPERLDFLAAMRVRDPAAYERARLRLRSVKVRVGALDQEVERRRPEPETSADGPGQVLEFPEIEPWHEPVDGAELFDALAEHLHRFVIMPSRHATTAVVLWAQHAHALDAAIHTPRLLVTSPTRECGKSQLMEWLAGIVPRPFDVVDPTGPNLFRPIEAHQPTVLIDEGDLVAWDERRDVKIVINAGHNRLSPGIPRCVGDDNETRVFRVWAPLAYSMIGKPLATMLSRSIVIGMKRMPPDRTPEYRRADRDQGFTTLRRQCARWAEDNVEALRQADPELPVTGRKANVWRPLVAIADRAGADWPERARAAALVLSKVEIDAEDYGVQLLADVHKVFDATNDEFLWTEDLLRHLHEMAERPWSEYGRSHKPITDSQLAKLLRPYKIRSRQRKRDGVNRRGFEHSQFESAWKRYVP